MKGALIWAVVGVLVLVLAGISARWVAARYGIDPTLVYGGLILIVGTVGGAVLGYVIRRQ